MTLKPLSKRRVAVGIGELLSCPFCGCKMGILHLGLWRWYGEHKTGCVLAGNPSHAYGRCEDLVRAWNTRQDNEKLSD